MKPLQVPSLCETCKFRGLVTNLNPEADTQNELLTRFFCKAPALYLNAEPFVLDIYSSLNDDNGNLVNVTSTIVNCTEYTQYPNLVITGVSYDNDGHTTISYTVNGSDGTDTLNLFVNNNLTPIGTVGTVANGTGTFTYNATLTVGDSYTFFGQLVTANFISNRMTLIPQAEVIIARSMGGASITGLAVNVTVANTPVADSVQVIVDGVNFGAPVAGVDNTVTSIARSGVLSPGAHTVVLHMVTGNVDSNLLNFTV